MIMSFLPVRFDCFDAESCQKIRLSIGVDSIRLGFPSPSMSWELRYRLKPKGWTSSEDGSAWFKTYADVGLKAWHLPWWIGGEVTLPRMVAGHNSSMEFDHWEALGKLKSLFDDDIRIQCKKRTWVSPSWSAWSVSRLDLTADFVFADIFQVNEVINDLKQLRMIFRPREKDYPTGRYWSSKSYKFCCSVYDKFFLTKRMEDLGKLRFTAKFNEKGRKYHLRKYGMRSVEELMSQRSMWVCVVRDQLAKLRPKEPTTSIQRVIEQAYATQVAAAHSKCVTTG
jgi:hypothetical protein